jgi:TolB protein
MNHQNGRTSLVTLMLAGFVFRTLAAQTNTTSLGLFEAHQDVGGPKKSGTAVFDSSRQTYTVTGGGINMWSTNDAFQFVWKKVSGDLTLAANIAFQGEGGDPHRKACLIVRQSLDDNSAYADAVLHGDGLTSLQYRESKGALTREIQSHIVRSQRLRIEKRGKYVSMSVMAAGEMLHPAGGSFRLVLEDPFYVGLAVCAHNENAQETAVFSNVELIENPPSTNRAPRLVSTLETVPLASKDRRVVWWTTNLIEAPNWSPDRTNLFFNNGGRIYRIPVGGGEPQVIDTGFAIRCNNDHGLSPDGTQIAISDQSQGDRRSRIYTLPIGGGQPKLITQSAPSYWHGWSPDGQTLAFCGERSNEFDIYTIPVAGGSETRLTSAAGLDDGPEYSPDGKYIYFNSDRTGRMQIWRMNADGTGQEQVTKDEYNNWFPHVSPNGRWIVFVSYESDVKGHPANKDVMLRVMPVQGGTIEVLAKLFGGQGTLNVPSWSPDSTRLAFVSYQLVP